MSQETTQSYDSRADTLAHIKRVSELLSKCSIEMQKRGMVHDDSKLEEPEKSLVDATTLKLRAMIYGSDEYKASMAELRPMLEHHYSHNSHHPEHYPKRDGGIISALLRASADEMKEQAKIGALHADEAEAAAALVKTADFMKATADHLEAEVNGMDLFDIVEMLMDWKAATERMKGGGDIRRSLDINTSRFSLSPQIVNILSNTIKSMGW